MPSIDRDHDATERHRIRSVDGRAVDASTAGTASARSCGARSAGEVRFDAGSRALYATDGSNYRQVPIGVVIPRDVDDVVATVARLPRSTARRSSRAAAARASPASAATSPSCIDFSKYLQPRPRDRPRAPQLARVQPGLRARRPARRGRAARPDLRPRPVDPQPLHARRDDRQQLLRRPLADGRHAPSDNVDELEILTYDGTAAARRRRRSEDELRAHHRARAAGAARSTAASTRSATATPTLIRARFPEIPRRVSGYNLDDLLPENGFHVARALVGHRGHLRHGPRGDACTWSPARRRASLARARLSRRLRGRRPRAARSSRPGRSAWKGSTTCSSTTCRRRASTPEDITLLPEGERLAAGRVRRRDARRRPTPRRSALMDALQGGDERAVDEARSTTRPSRRRICGRSASRASARPPASPASPTPGRAGRTPPSRPNSVGAYLRDLRKRCSTSTATSCVALRPLRPGLHPHAGSTSTSTTRRGRRALPRLPGRGGRPRRRATAARSRASTATASRGPRCCRRCSAPELVAGVPRVQGDLGPGRQDEPGQGRRPLPARPRTSGSAPTTTRRSSTTHFTLPRRQAAASPTRRERCVGVGKCRTERRRHHVPELHGDQRGEALDARPRPPALRDAPGRRRSKDGWKSEAVQRGARPLPGVQGLQERLPGERRHGDLQGRVPRRTTTRAGCGRGTPTRWA